MITLSSKCVGVFFLSHVSEAQNNPLWRSSIFTCSIFCRSIALSYSHFPLISLVFVACFSNVRHKRIKMPGMVLGTEDPRVNKRGPLPWETSSSGGRVAAVPAVLPRCSECYKDTFSCFSSFRENGFSLNRFYAFCSPLLTLPLERWNNFCD